MPISNLVKQGGGTDLHAYTPFYVRETSSTATYTTLLNVTGKGILNQVLSLGSSGSALEVRLTIDGVIVGSDIVVSPQNSSQSTRSMLQNLPFKSNLKLEVRRPSTFVITAEAVYLLA